MAIPAYINCGDEIYSTKIDMCSPFDRTGSGTGNPVLPVIGRLLEYLVQRRFEVCDGAIDIVQFVQAE